jgi:hypothetical protein
MAKGPRKPRPYGAVLVSDEIRGLIGREQIGNAIANLRMGGGDCWVCDKPLKRSESVSFVIDRASTVLRMGFMHLHHGPSQILELRDDRRASVALHRRLVEQQSDATAFVSYREYPKPRASIVVSPQSPMIYANEGGKDAIYPMLELWRDQGLEPVNPPVIDAVPSAVVSATVTVSDHSGIEVKVGDMVLFVGQLPMPAPWLAAIEEERACGIVVSGLAVVSDELQNHSNDALDALASRSLLIGATATATFASETDTPAPVG